MLPNLVLLHIPTPFTAFTLFEEMMEVMIHRWFSRAVFLCFRPATVPNVWQNIYCTCCFLPSGKLTQQWKITIFNGKIHYKWPFSIAMLVHQRVTHVKIPHFWPCPRNVCGMLISQGVKPERSWVTKRPSSDCYRSHLRWKESQEDPHYKSAAVILR